MSLFLSKTFGYFCSAIFIISISMFVPVLSVCVVCVPAVLGMNSRDRPSAIQFHSIQCKYFILDRIPESSLAFCNWIQVSSFCFSSSPCLRTCCCVAFARRQRAWRSTGGRIRLWKLSEVAQVFSGLKMWTTSVDTDRATSPSIACYFWSLTNPPVGSCKRDVQLGRGGRSGATPPLLQSSFPLSPSEHSHGKNNSQESQHLYSDGKRLRLCIPAFCCHSFVSLSTFYSKYEHSPTAVTLLASIVLGGMMMLMLTGCLKLVVLTPAS